jgi:DMSO/TMAO reductase YedYZ molybdopterin-dependent catalytic subunit
VWSPLAVGAGEEVEGVSDAVARIGALVRRADDLRKAASNAGDVEVARERIARTLEDARALLPEVTEAARRHELAADIARRVADLDHEAIVTLLGPSPDVAPAPTRGVDPARIPPGQHLTAGFPVLHVGSVPPWTADDVRVVVTGLVEHRTVLGWDDLRSFDETTVTRDFHCVTTWSRLDTTWTGVRVRDVLARAGVRDGASHVIVSGYPAYSANLPLEHLVADDALLAWGFDGGPLAPAHGGPLRLVVPALYGWKSVKWVTELRLLDHDVPGYWEERGYHLLGDPWREQRFRGD